MQLLIHLIFASVPVGDPTAADLRDLLAAARARNERAGLTGMMLHSDGTFLHVLEGTPADVDRAFRQFVDDPRHTSVVTIARERISVRAFGAWSMGYVTDSAEDLYAAQRDGGTDVIAQAACFDALPAGRAKWVLGAFRAGRWDDEVPITLGVAV